MTKMSNIVICGLPEDLGTVDERAQEDKEGVQALFTALDVKSVEVNGELGKSNKDKSRLPRASLPDPSTRQEVLRRAKLLKNST